MTQTINVSLEDILTGSVVRTNCQRCSSTIRVETPNMLDLTQVDNAASRYGLPFTAAEARIFNCLYASLGQILDNRRIVLGSWGPEYLDTSNYAHLLRVNIARIRAKLLAADSLFSIETEPSRGYRLVGVRQADFFKLVSPAAGVAA